MVDVAFSAARLLGAFFLVALNGFFVAAEFAFVRIRSASVQALVEEGRAGATLLQECIESLDDYLAVTQLGITIASLGLGWIGEPAVAALIEPVVAPYLSESAVHIVAFAVGFGFITFLHVVFGELAPKTIAIARAERIALLVAPPMRFFYYVFLPGLVVFNGTANFFTRLIGVEPASESEETFSEEELLTVVTRSARYGDLDADEVEMIERVFELDDTSVRDVMIPRPDVESIPADLSVPELRSVILEAGHTRYPIVEAEEADRVVGFVDAKDVLRAIDEASEDDATVMTAGELARDLPVVPESGTVDDLLATFQSEHRQMAAVIDEWGAFEGIATVEDVVEELVGDLRDDFDAVPEPSIESHGEGTHVVDGGAPLSRVNETLGTDFEGDEFATVAGLVLDRLGRAPEVGDQIAADGYTLRVDRVDGDRISRLVVRESADEPGDDTLPDADRRVDESSDADRDDGRRPG